MTHSNHGIFAIWDRKAAYMLPAFSAQNDASAERMFTETVMTSQTPVSQYPAEFDLIRIGTVDLEKGVITPVTPPDLLINGLVALTEAQRERRRYQAILDAPASEEPLPEAS